MHNTIVAGRVTAAVMLAFAISSVWACQDPARHPGIAKFNELVESWGEQPTLPVEMRFKLHDAPRVGLPAEVELAYWPFGSYDHGRFSITPSDGLDLVGFAGSADIPDKGSYRFSVRPTRKGYHYLQVENSVTVDGETIRRLAAIPVAVETEHEALADAPARFGFAGPRLKNILGVASEERPSAWPHGQ